MAPQRSRLIPLAPSPLQEHLRRSRPDHVSHLTRRGVQQKHSCGVCAKDFSMQFDIHALPSGDAYKLLASVVVPRPIALVTTLGPDGQINAAPFSFFNMVGGSPPVVALGIADRAPGSPKDTRGNLVRTGCFVVNLVDEELAEAMNICSIDFPNGESEMDAAGLTSTASVSVSTPRIAESSVQLECRLAQIVSVGDNKIVLGEVVFLHIRDEFVDTEKLRVRSDALQLIGRMHGGGWYARTSDLFDMPRVSYAQWQAQHPDMPAPAS